MSKSYLIVSIIAYFGLCVTARRYIKLIMEIDFGNGIARAFYTRSRKYFASF